MCVMFYFYNFLLRSAAQLRPPCHARPSDAEKWKSGKKQQKQLQQTTIATTTTTALAVKVFQFFVSSLHLHACVSVCVCIFSALKYECICISESFFCLPFSLFATRIGTSGGRSASSSAFALRKLQRIIFTLRQRIWSVSRRCLYVCVCECAYISYDCLMLSMPCAFGLWHS